jgi:hypothetical protein
MFFDRLIQSLERVQFKYWLLFACIARVVLSITYQSYNHPDEWYQTLEFSNLLWGKKATYSPEIFWHMRNLSWPWILSLVSRLAYKVSPQSLFLQTTSIQLFCTTLDVITVWFVVKILDKLEVSDKKLWGIFFLTAHFLLKDSSRPSQDHISTMLFYGALFLSFYEHWFFVGLLTSLVGATKYASGLLSVGLYLSFLILFFLKNINLKHFMKIHAGIILGILVGGLADYIFYGTFYESMWSYFYFNIYSGLMNKIFGEQSAFVFIQYLFSQWKVVHFSFFVVGLIILFKNIRFIFKRNILILVPILVLLGGSFIIKHKEGRFVTQIEIALWISLALGLNQLKTKKYGTRILGGLILLNLIFSAGNLVGDLNKPTFSYLKLPSILKISPKTCAAITLKRPLGIFHLDPTIPQAYWNFGKKDEFTTSSKNLKLVWISPHQCQDDDRVLIQTYNQDLTTLGCLNLETFGSKWFSCPTALLSQFKNQEVRNIFLESFPFFPTPNFKTDPNLMLSLQKAFEQQNNLSIGSMPDL